MLLSLWLIWQQKGFILIFLTFRNHYHCALHYQRLKRWFTQKIMFLKEFSQKQIINKFHVIFYLIMGDNIKFIKNNKIWCFYSILKITYKKRKIKSIINKIEKTYFLLHWKKKKINTQLKGDMDPSRRGYIFEGKDYPKYKKELTSSNISFTRDVPLCSLESPTRENHIGGKEDKLWNL